MLRQRAVCLQFNVTVFYSLNTIPTHGLYCLHISVMYSSVATVRSFDRDVDMRSAGRGLSKMATKVNTSATIGATMKSELSLEFPDSIANSHDQD